MTSGNLQSRIKYALGNKQAGDEMVGLLIGPSVPGSRKFYVSSTRGSADNDGEAPDRPVLTVAAALLKCTANYGDEIHLLPGHNEGIGNAQLTWNVAGVRIIGWGFGTLKPRFDFDHANASIDVTANNMFVTNIALLPSVTGVVIGIDVNAAVVGTWLDRIEVLPGEDGAGVDEFVLAIDLKAGCNQTQISRPKHRQHASAAGSVASISLTGASDDVYIYGTADEWGYFDMAGAALVAPINGITTLSTGIRIERCIFVTDAAEPGYEMITGSLGTALDCLVFSNHATLAGALVGDGIARFRCENIELAAESGGVIGTASVDD